MAGTWGGSCEHPEAQVWRTRLHAMKNEDDIVVFLEIDGADGFVHAQDDVLVFRELVADTRVDLMRASDTEIIAFGDS